MLAGCVPTQVDPASVDYAHIHRMCDLGAANEADRIGAALDATAAWAEPTNGRESEMDQFIFDQDPVPGSRYRPDFRSAAESVWRKCSRAWARA